MFTALCPWVIKSGEPWTFQHTPVLSLSPPLTPLQIPPAASTASSFTRPMGDAPGGDLTVLQDLEQMRREKDEQARIAVEHFKRSAQLYLDNSNL